MRSSSRRLLPNPSRVILCLSAGIRSSGNNVLLHGPPGTGKTTIAQAASQEAGAAFYSVTPSSILSKYQGACANEERTRHLYDRSRKVACVDPSARRKGVSPRLKQNFSTTRPFSHTARSSAPSHLSCEQKKKPFDIPIPIA